MPSAKKPRRRYVEAGDGNCLAEMTYAEIADRIAEKTGSRVTPAGIRYTVTKVERLLYDALLPVYLDLIREE